MRQHMLAVDLTTTCITHVLDVKLIPRHLRLEYLSSQAVSPTGQAKTRQTIAYGVCMNSRQRKGWYS